MAKDDDFKQRESRAMSEDLSAMNRRIDEWIHGCVSREAAQYTESWRLIEVIERRMTRLGWRLAYTCNGSGDPHDVDGHQKYHVMIEYLENRGTAAVRANGKTLQLAVSRGIDLAIRLVEDAEPKVKETPSVENPTEPWMVLMDFIRTRLIGDDELVLLVRDQARVITPEIATRLESIFPQRSASYWLQLEADYRAALARNAVKEEVAAGMPPRQK